VIPRARSHAASSCSQRPKAITARKTADLKGKLLAELPGILGWALDGLDRLTRRGKFTTPASSDEATAVLLDLSSPVAAFVRDECKRGPTCEIGVQELYAAWRRWCEANGNRPRASSTFGRDLRAVIPEVRNIRPPHNQPRRYAGVTLKNHHNGGSSAANELGGNPWQPSPQGESEPDDVCPVCGSGLRSDYERRRGVCEKCLRSDPCPVCGDPLDGPALTVRCRDKHRRVS